MALLRAAAGRHPGDVWVNHALAGALDRLRPSAREEAVRYYTAARALRPETAHELAHLLERHGPRRRGRGGLPRPDGSTAGERAAPGLPGEHLKENGRAADAAPILERAVAAARAAIRLQPDDAEAHSNLGNALASQGKVDEAVAEYRDRRSGSSPTTPRPTPTSATPWRGQGKLDEAVAEFRAAIRLQPDYAEAHYNLGNALAAQGKRDEAVAEYRTAIRLKPDYAKAHCNLGTP